MKLNRKLETPAIKAKLDLDIDIERAHRFVVYLINKLTNFLGQLRVKFPIIGISETWVMIVIIFPI